MIDEAQQLNQITIFKEDQNEANWKRKKKKGSKQRWLFHCESPGHSKLVCEVHLQDMTFRYWVMDLWTAILDGCAIDCNVKIC